ncbi:MAG: hypothetical protein R3C61_21970 [Bacteroidia bacterium]
MSAKETSLNILKRCGFETEYQFNENEVTMNCLSDNNGLALVIILTCKFVEIVEKGVIGTEYQIEEAKIINLQTETEEKFESTGKVVRARGYNYLVPGKRIIDKILLLVDINEGYKDLWQLSIEILNQGTENLDKLTARNICAKIPSIRIVNGEIIHPLIFTGRRKNISFISRAMLEYCLALELNEKKNSSKELRKYISSYTLEFLDYDFKEYQGKVLTPIQELKKNIVKQQRYEDGAILRDLELNLLPEYLSNVWPNFSLSGAITFLNNRLHELNLDQKLS